MLGGPLGSKERERYFALLGQEINPQRELRHFLASLLREDARLTGYQIPHPDKEMEALLLSRLTAQNAVSQLDDEHKIIAELFFHFEAMSQETKAWLRKAPGEVQKLKEEALEQLVEIIYDESDGHHTGCDR